MKLGMVRAVDKMGRVVIPKSIRKQLDIKDNVDSFEIYMEGENVILRKYQPTCIFCDTVGESVELGGRIVCKNCVERLNLLKEESEQE